jgi:hypothetical protein
MLRHYKGNGERKQTARKKEKGESREAQLALETG